MSKILGFMESLIDESIALERLTLGDSAQRSAEGFTRRYQRLANNIVGILKYIGLNSHLQEAEEVLSSNAIYLDENRLLRLAGIIGSAYDLTKNGVVDKIKFLLHAEMFDSVIEQAKALNDGGHLVPAAVLGRIVMEDWLKDEAERAGLNFDKGAKAAVVNDSLKKAGVLSMPKWRQIQVLLDIGNSAAHGKTTDFSDGDVSRLLEFVETNCI